MAEEHERRHRKGIEEDLAVGSERGGKLHLRKPSRERDAPRRWLVLRRSGGRLLDFCSRKSINKLARVGRSLASDEEGVTYHAAGVGILMQSPAPNSCTIDGYTGMGATQTSGGEEGELIYLRAGWRVLLLSLLFIASRRCGRYLLNRIESSNMADGIAEIDDVNTTPGHGVNFARIDGIPYAHWSSNSSDESLSSCCCSSCSSCSLSYSYESDEYCDASSGCNHDDGGCIYCWEDPYASFQRGYGASVSSPLPIPGGHRD